MNEGQPAPAAGTAARLVDATRRCIAEGGVTSATSREIAAAAGTNLQAITYHYGSKDDLVAVALLASVREWVEPALAELRGSGDAATRMLTAVQALTSRFEERSGDAPALLEALVQATRHPTLRESVLGLWADLKGELTERIVELRREGHVPTWVEPVTMASLLVAVAQGLVLQVTVDPDGPSMPELAAQFATLLLQAQAPAR